MYRCGWRWGRVGLLLERRVRRWWTCSTRSIRDGRMRRTTSTVDADTDRVVTTATPSGGTNSARVGCSARSGATLCFVDDSVDGYGRPPGPHGTLAGDRPLENRLERLSLRKLPAPILSQACPAKFPLTPAPAPLLVPYQSPLAPQSQHLIQRQAL